MFSRKLLVVLGCLGCVAGCGEAGSESQESSLPPAQSYTVAGTIVELPSTEPPGQDLSIRHDEIPEFVGRSGEATGMRAMTMPFPHIADDVSLEGLAVGTDVRFTFLVDYAADPIYIVTDLEPVPAVAESELEPDPE